jgi:hypothetical protein
MQALPVLLQQYFFSLQKTEIRNFFHFEIKQLQPKYLPKLCSPSENNFKTIFLILETILKYYNNT